jgi:hypothetical protein
MWAEGIALGERIRLGEDPDPTYEELQAEIEHRREELERWRLRRLQFTRMFSCPVLFLRAELGADVAVVPIPLEGME